MLKKILLIVFITALFAQEQSITNIIVGQRTDGSGIIDIHYDLNDPTETFPSFEVDAEITFDNGETWQTISNFSPNGDFGTVATGTGKHITLNLYEGLYSSEAQIKIIASGHYVTSELPFATVLISPSEVITFESETIDYSFEIMQYELTNAQLVSWLETYSFENADNYDPDNPWSDTAEARYICSDYNEYYNDPFDTGEDNSGIEGCTDPNAYNYNPYAGGGGGDDPCECIDDSNLGCADENAVNYIDNEDGCPEYDDCSCQYVNTNYTDYGEEANICPWGSIYIDDYDLGYYFNEWYQDVDGPQTFTTCTDPNAINYSYMFHAAANTMNNVAGIECVTIEDDGSCVYECANEYDWQNETYDNPDSIPISSFQTQDISFQESAFTIAPQKGDHPVRFSAQSCLHSIVLSLYMDYFGLRIPTAGEWMKSARGDDTKCWPWMSGSCQNDSQLACGDNCIEQEYMDECSNEVNNCIQECTDIQEDCNTSFATESLECIQNCSSNFEYQCLGAGEILNQYTTEEDCINNGGLEWIETDIPIYQNCYDCINDFDSSDWYTCFDSEGQFCYCDDGSSQLLSECSECISECNLGENNGHPCDVYNPNDDENICVDQEVDINNDGIIDNPSCFGDYADFCNAGDCHYDSCYNNTNECWETYNQCAGIEDCQNGVNIDEDLSCSQCNVIDTDVLLYNVSSDQSEDPTSFIQDLYFNKMNYFIADNDDSSWPLEAVGSYPEGVSSYGLYDVIGNVPELTKSNNELYLLGTIPLDTEQVWSFCSDSSIGNEYGHQSKKLMEYYNGNHNKYYGVRLARNVSE